MPKRSISVFFLALCPFFLELPCVVFGRGAGEPRWVAVLQLSAGLVWDDEPWLVWPELDCWVDIVASRD